MKKGWTSQNHHNELGMAKIRVEVKERLYTHAKTLLLLQLGDTVQVYNQTVSKPMRKSWT